MSNSFAIKATSFPAVSNSLEIQVALMREEIL